MCHMADFSVASAWLPDALTPSTLGRTRARHQGVFPTLAEPRSTTRGPAKLVEMARTAPRRRMPPPRRKIVWLRAVPIFVLMMGALLLGQTVLRDHPDSPLNAGGGIGLSLLTGLVGAFLISRFATVEPPPPPSKSQQRRVAAAARAKDAGEDSEVEEEAAPIRARAAAGRRRRRRR